MKVLDFIKSGGAEGSRTPDLLRAKEALSQLSYSPTADTSIKRNGGFGETLRDGQGRAEVHNKQDRARKTFAPLV